jgi:hypothetical protein
MARVAAAWMAGTSHTTAQLSKPGNVNPIIGREYKYRNVLPGLGPGIHVLATTALAPKKTWMAGSSPAKTSHNSANVIYFRNPR